MAIFYLRTKLIRASSGKSAISSAAYQAGVSLYSEQYGQTFSYTTKEEVVHSQVMLPENAPVEYNDRGVLWNAVERVQNKANSRYARQFLVALPREWTKEECIDRSAEFVQEAFVNKGMAADWSFHMKDDNPHLHIMVTVRGFNPDGSWKSMEKKAYALTPNGERIPEIDPNTGEQKVRIRTRNGRQSKELIWQRITVESNDWNKRSFLLDTKKLWAEHCNRYLLPEQHIDCRSYRERGIARVPMLHEGSAARRALQKGVVFDVVKENAERKQLNVMLAQLERFILKAKSLLKDMQKKLDEWRRKQDGQTRSRNTAGDGSIAVGISKTAARGSGRAQQSGNSERIDKEAAELKKRTERIRKRHRRHR